jgi:type VI secretion system protein ImpA
MTVALDLAALLAPVGTDDPCGPDLEYDRDFGALERLAQSKPEQQMGERVIAAEDPDWKNLAPQALALLTRTKDLRIACHLAKALLRLDGLRGFSDGVRLIRGLLEQYWPTVYPRLDADDNDDPTMRVNALSDLAEGPTVAALQRTPLVTGPLGRFSLRDFALAKGELPPPPDQTAPDIARIEAAFEAANLTDLEATLAAVERTREDLGAIDSLLTDKAGSAHTTSLTRLTGLLDQAVTEVGLRLERRRPDDTEPSGTNGESTGGASGEPSSGRGMPGQIRSRDDVVKALDQVCAYYDRNEPSSPVPLLMRRARRLVKMSFVDIIKDMAPDAVSQVTLIGGSEPESQ